MRDVSIIGFGQTPVGEHWELSLRHIAAQAVLAAMQDAGIDRADALYVGNMIASETSGQHHLGALVADFVGLRGIEAFRVEAACASGAAALRAGYLAVASGAADLVIVVGLEKMTDAIGNSITTALAEAADADYETPHGLSFVSINALLMRRYMYEFGVRHEDFAGFAITAHQNAVNNPYAMFRRPITKEEFVQARMIADPINLLDSSPVADGAAAVVLCPTDQARSFSEYPVHIRACEVGTDSLALHDRRDPLFLEAAYISVQKAYARAGVTPADIDLFELHDAFTIMAALSLEAAGFARRGEGVRLAMDGAIALNGRIPISTMGGLKGRGHPVGATGVYQVIEVAQQVTGRAGANQVPNARLGMAQNIGGSGATVITTILEA
ncbi:MAG: thiolase domain-containing protein [Anaerolineae bacterium]|nr:thiolase domain-containing protein [Anaerolineae bacterium]